MKKGDRIVSHIGGIPIVYEATGEKSPEGWPVVIMVGLGRTAQKKMGCELIKLKGTGEWHACTLKNGMWTGVSPHFKTKAGARLWATENGFEIVKS